MDWTSLAAESKHRETMDGSETPLASENPSEDFEQPESHGKDSVVEQKTLHPIEIVTDEENKQNLKTYPNRFWILSWFCFLGWYQCLQWNTWGPLSESVAVAFPGWGSGTVAMMANWGTITFVTCIVPMCWLMNTKGLRVGVLSCAAMVAAGTVFRALAAITDSAVFFTVASHVCAILNGIPGTLIMAAPPMIAAEWFPPCERTTATALGQAFNGLGNAGSYLEPLIVRSPANGSPAEIRDDIRILMCIYGGVATALLLVIFIYYPAKPPTPPSVSSSVDRWEFKDSLRKMIRNRDLILLTLSYGVSAGVPGCWIAVLNFSLEAVGIHQDEAMWIGLVSVISAAVTASISGRLTDISYGHLRISLIILMSASLACFYWFFLITWGSIPVVLWQIYVSVACGNALNFATCPLFFELAVERAYPCPEILVGGLLTATNNLVALIFLFAFLIPSASFDWVTYLLLCTGSLSIIPILFVKEDYSRSTLDRGKNLHSNYFASSSVVIREMEECSR